MKPNMAKLNKDVIGTQLASKDHVRNEALSQIYANAAAWLERTPGGSADVAIRKITERLSFRVSSEACIVFRDNFGCWNGDDDGVMMLCFASAIAWHGELNYIV